MKIAVIGGGISGNIAAHQLASDHRVTLFEANPYLGGHTHTHDISWQGQSYAVDTGFIVFNHRTYPEFTQLLQRLDVAYQPTEMSFSVKCEATGLEYNGHSLNTLFAQRRNLIRPAFYRMIRDILRFNREAVTCLDTEAAEMPLGDYLAAEGYSREFKEHYIIPMGAAIWSTDPERMQAFPARFFMRFFHNHGLLNVRDRPTWYVIQGGSKQYLEPLSRPYAGDIRLGAAVHKLRRLPGQVEVNTVGQPPEMFDAVFVAAHSDQALAMLSQPKPNEAEVLGAIAYQPNEAVLHTDHSLLPKRRLAWAAWNYHLSPEAGEKAALTYNMNILQGIRAPVEFCVTLNNTDAIHPDAVIKRLQYEHPVFTQDTVKAQARHREINGLGRIYYCGAYWGNGFHEDGVASALRAINHFNEDMGGHEKLHLRRAG